MEREIQKLPFFVAPSTDGARCLDTEGSEPEILLSIPFASVDIDVIQVECNDCLNAKKNHSAAIAAKRYFLKTLLDLHGFDEVDYLTLDFVYKKRR